MAALAETYRQQTPPPLELAEFVAPQLSLLPQFETVEPVMPRALLVSELAADEFTRHQATRFIGQALLSKTVEHTVEAPAEQPFESLHDAIKAAQRGDPVARQNVTANVRTEGFEITTKVGIHERVPIEADDQGKFYQYGQKMEAVHGNSLVYASNHPAIQARSEAETRNLFRAEQANREGYFDDGYVMVVLERAADDMTPEEMKGIFFTDTMSISAQLIGKDKDGLFIQAAFVAGVKEPGADRHDADMVRGFGGAIGVDLADRGATTGIDNAVLVPIELIPNGLIDVVKILDEVGGTFFGEAKPRQDYLEYEDLCRQRQQTFEPKVLLATEELIAEADDINTPVGAIKRLHKITEGHMVLQAIEDETINPLVFGPKAAEHIVRARLHRQQGDDIAASQDTKQAVTTARSLSCPTALLDGSGEEDQYGTLQFECPNGHTNTRPRGELIPHCQRCGASVKC